MDSRLKPNALTQLGLSAKGRIGTDNRKVPIGTVPAQRGCSVAGPSAGTVSIGAFELSRWRDGRCGIAHPELFGPVLGVGHRRFIVTHLRQLMLDELQRRNYSPSTVRCYIHALEDFAKYFHRSPERLDPSHIREYQLHLFRDRKLSPGTIQSRTTALDRARR